MNVKDIYRRILKELKKYGPALIADAMADIYDDQAAEEDFGELFPEARGSILRLAALAAVTVMEQRPGWHKVLARMIRRVEAYVEKSPYLHMSEEELRREFEKDVPVAVLKRGITPELLIFYFVACRRQYAHPMLPFLAEEYRRQEQRIAETPPAQFVRLEGELEGSLLEQELNLFLADDFHPKDDRFIEEVSKKYRGNYDPSSRTVRVPRGLVMFLEARLGRIRELEEGLLRLHGVIGEYWYKAQRILKKAAEVHAKNEELERRVKELEGRVRELEREREELERRLRAVPERSSLELEVERLKKELQSARKRIAHLEARIAELEEEEEILPEIGEEVEVVPERPVLRTVQIEPLSRIVVSGGKYTSQDEQEIEELLAPLGCTVRFIPAEETLRHKDVFKSADLVFFDTSRHAHKFFEKVRSLNPRVVLVSGKRELRELVSRAAGSPQDVILK